MDNIKVWNSQSADWQKNLLYPNENLFIQWIKKIAKKSDKILDQGTGVGQYAFSVYRQGFQNVVGMDFSSELLEQANENAKKLGYKIKFVKGDIRKMPFKDSEFKIIISGGIVEHVPETETTIGELSRVLKNQGWLLIHVPYKYSLFTLLKKTQQFLGI